MPNPTHPARLFALLALLALPAAAFAQRSGEMSLPTVSVTGEYLTMKAQLSVDFWTARLNAYRDEVDGMLSAPDRLEADELRARFAHLLERMRRLEEADWRASRGDNAYTTDTTTMTEAAADGYAVDADDYYAATTDTTATGYGSAEANDYEAIQRQQQAEWEQARIEEQRRDLRWLERILGGDEASIASLDDDFRLRERSASSKERAFIQEEMQRVRHTGQWIARNYSSGMEQLLERFFADLGNFRKVLLESTGEFYRTNREAIVRDEDAVQMLLEVLGGPSEEEQRLRMMMTTDRPEAEMIRSMIEGGLIAYGGQDMRELMTIGGLPFANPVAERLPAAGTLGQYSPNPAATRTTILYTIGASGSRVLLQMLDARGVVVATFDQGVRDAGDHMATIDVTTLPSGSYLYQLQVATPAGTRSYAKSMEVAK